MGGLITQRTPDSSGSSGSRGSARRPPRGLCCNRCTTASPNGRQPSSLPLALQPSDLKELSTWVRRGFGNPITGVSYGRTSNQNMENLVEKMMRTSDCHAAMATALPDTNYLQKILLMSIKTIVTFCILSEFLY